MNLKTQFSEYFATILKKLLDINTTNLDFTDQIFQESPEFVFIIKFSITTYNICLFIFLFLFLVNLIINIFFKLNSVVTKFVKYLNFLLLSVANIFLVLKFYISLKLENLIGLYFYDIKSLFFFKNQNNYILEHYMPVASSLSDTIVLLCFIVGVIVLDLLGSKNLLKSLHNITIFFLFNFFIIIMVTTNNLLLMFISFEFIFFPTVYFAYTTGYSKKIDTSVKVMIWWTLFGSFLVLLNLAYIYSKFNSLNYIYLTTCKFSSKEVQFLCWNFLIGFGIKVPLAPFHNWLLKIHVEAPAAFSMYLSGFLVKSAVYCLYMCVNIFHNTQTFFTLSTIWIAYSLIIGTFGLARQTDIKKLIAWATIQEMSMIMLLLLYKQMFLSSVAILFIFLHGVMSTYMFYLVDILQRRYKTRSVQYITGLNLLFPELTKYVWFLILLFSGFPLTIKFFIEWQLLSLLIETNQFFLLTLLFCTLFLGTVVFCKILFSVMYGLPNIKDDEIDRSEIQHKERTILRTLTVIILLLLYTAFII